jgi:hypothetical protein
LAGGSAGPIATNLGTAAALVTRRYEISVTLKYSGLLAKVGFQAVSAAVKIEGRSGLGDFP